MTAEVVSLASYRMVQADTRGKNGWSILEKMRPRELGEGLGGTVPRREQRWADHRAEPRHAFEGRCAPTLTLEGMETVIRNISRSGLMAAVPVKIVPGSRLLASIAGYPPLSARVIWSRDGIIGLEVPIGNMVRSIV